MSQQQRNQTLALAGVFQAATAVDKLAREGRIEPELLSAMVESVLNLNPESFDDIFKGTNNLTLGLNTLTYALAKHGHGVSKDVLQYGMSIITAQTKLSKRADLMNALSTGLNRAVDQHAYFNDFLHESVISSTATTYQNSVSKLDFRIRIIGNPTYLQNNRVADQVRSILLFGVRCAFLWRQQGGRRWQLLTSRSALLREAKALSRVA